MIRMIQSKTKKQAKSYYTNSLQKADYYARDELITACFHGKMTTRLGITGSVTKDMFHLFCENIHPYTGTPLTPRSAQNRTVGYDINFHCPKSVSVLYALTGNKDVMLAFREAVNDTMQDIEQDSQTRVRRGGVAADRDTGELLWADFVHLTARPVKGFAPDPHLHAHCYTFNLTWDAAEHRMKAAKFKNIKRDMPYYQALFHKRLSDNLQQIGFGIRRTKTSFEIATIPDTVIQLFSKRTEAIGRMAKEQGITDAKGLDALGAKTRNRKNTNLTIEALQAIWAGQMQAAGFGHYDTMLLPDNTNPAPLSGAQAVIDYALSHCFERASVIPERRVLQTALQQAIGKNIDTDKIQNAFQAQASLLRFTEYEVPVCSTKAVLQEELYMVELAKAGRGMHDPFYHTQPPISLEGEQGNAVQYILSSSNRVMIIRGGAGTGKTTLMTEAIRLIRATGQHVTVVAPTAEAARGVLRNEGFTDAQTVAMLLTDKAMQDATANGVVWVDEAGLLGNSDMLALLQLVTRTNARLILGGDTRQHSSVARGDALRILQKIAHIPAVSVNRIYRQQHEDYKKAVTHLAQGDTKTGFELLDKAGAIKSMAAECINQALVDDYLQALKRGKTALVISPTHAQGEAVTQAIRQALKDKGMLHNTDTVFTRYKALHLTEAEKTEANHYQTGYVLQFNQHVQGIKRGSRWIVKAVYPYELIISDDTSMERALPLTATKAADVFEAMPILLMVGDRIRITRNAFDTQKRKLNNGQQLIVSAICPINGLTVQSKAGDATYCLPVNFGHIAHAYCMTSHASQGATADEVLIVQPAATFNAANAKQFYVSVSRGRYQAIIYTDDKVGLLQRVMQDGDRQGVTESEAMRCHQLHLAIHLRSIDSYPNTGLQQQDTPTPTGANYAP
ncbi:hypothetical protein CAP35_04720 [Chitinophagaceae bacterium IBVUCB1]|nr:hypothetical protein CAP35_04720 [Chitinophagaceae bacterium IBVUCB1]